MQKSVLAVHKRFETAQRSQLFWKGVQQGRLAGLQRTPCLLLSSWSCWANRAVSVLYLIAGYK